MLILSETKPVALATYHDRGNDCQTTLWKYTPEDYFQGGKAVYWLQSHSPIRSGWKTKNLSLEEAEEIWLRHGWTRTKICVPQFQPMQSRSGLVEVEPNVFVEAS